MESKLPEDLQKEIANKAAAYADQAHANDGDDIHIGYLDAANEWAQWKVKYDELKGEYIDLGKRHNTAQTALTEQAFQYQALKERCDKMGAALKELVRLKDKKDKEGSFIGYPTLKQAAWEDAREALKEGESNTPDRGEGETKEINMSYTKGEWYLQKYTDAYTNIIRCNNGKHETIFIASTPQSTLPETRANAKLMSAAPDLLEALQEIIAITDRDHIAWVKAKAAIQKAIGNENQSKTF